MIEDIGNSEWWNRLVEFVVELFATATAASMFRWMIIAWGIFVVVAIVGDRFSSFLLGRSRPRVQRPPARARAWRWRRRPIPPTYSALPVGTIGPMRPTPASSIPLALPASTTSGRMVLVERRWLVSAESEDSEYWSAHADDTVPLFGVENHGRLRRGEPPERFNPLTRKIERLERHETTGHLQWPFPETFVVDEQDDPEALDEEVEEILDEHTEDLEEGDDETESADDESELSSVGSGS